MRYIPELLVFMNHPEWWTHDKDRKYIIPTKEAPPEAVEAIRIVNEKIKNDEVE